MTTLEPEEGRDDEVGLLTDVPPNVQEQRLLTAAFVFILGVVSSPFVVLLGVILMVLIGSLFGAYDPPPAANAP